MMPKIFYFGFLLFVLISCKNSSSPATVTLKKGKYEIWDDKPFAYRPCGGDTSLADSALYGVRELPKDTTLEVQSFIIDGENTFVHNAQFMWIRTSLPFSEEELKYLRFLFPIDRRGKDCKPIYGYFLNKNLHKVYVNNCIVDVKKQKCTKMDMSIYESCFLEGEYVLCKIKNSDKVEKWNEAGERD